MFDELFILISDGAGGVDKIVIYLHFQPSGKSHPLESFAHSILQLPRTDLHTAMSRKPFSEPHLVSLASSQVLHLGLFDCCRCRR